MASDSPLETNFRRTSAASPEARPCGPSLREDFFDERTQVLLEIRQGCFVQSVGSAGNRGDTIRCTPGGALQGVFEQRSDCFDIRNARGEQAIKRARQERLNRRRRGVLASTFHQ